VLRVCRQCADQAGHQPLLRRLGFRTVLIGSIAGGAGPRGDRLPAIDDADLGNGDDLDVSGAFHRSASVPTILRFATSPR
jgi:hypothetical protein